MVRTLSACALALAWLPGLAAQYGPGKPLPAPCACKEQQHCAPLSTPPPDHELFPFVVNIKAPLYRHSSATSMGFISMVSCSKFSQ